jgi:hypothetical protein
LEAFIDSWPSLELCIFSTDAIGLSGTFLLYGTTCVAAGIFFYCMLPETMGKTLEQIDEELSTNRYVSSLRI